MVIEWRLRTVAAEHGVWSGAQLQRLLAKRAGLELSSAAIAGLLSRQPRELKLSTLAALCVALECSPGELLVMRRVGPPWLASVSDPAVS